MRSGQRMTSPRSGFRSTVSVKALIETYLARKRSSTAPSRIANTTRRLASTISTGQTFDLRRLKETDRARFDNSVRNGKNQMPPWKGKLTDDEIDQLWHYIRANAYQK